jgi:hypothetical protein
MVWQKHSNITGYKHPYRWYNLAFKVIVRLYSCSLVQPGFYIIPRIYNIIFLRKERGDKTDHIRTQVHTITEQMHSPTVSIKER